MRAGKIDDSSIQVRLSFIQKLFSSLPATPLTHHEMIVAQNMSKLRDYEENFLSEPLTNLLARMKGKVSLRDAVFLLIDAHDLHQERTAVEILESIDEEDRKISTESLVRIFTESLDGIVPHLMIGVLGEDQDEEEEPITRLPSGLNREAMDRFLNGL